ncbi:hypothetical protein I317_01890 [Kwoniella heveanensis CBS 569]|nr:hypothetical protein I317_01890 [Kwoniella heveanensis CBS 569]
MPYPASVERLPLPRSKRRGRRNRDEATEAQRTQVAASKARANDTDLDNGSTGAGGVVLDFGKAGGAGLEQTRRGWAWSWASEDRKDLKLKIGDTATCLFPPTRKLDPHVSHAPTKEIVDVSTRYVESLCDPYERYGLREAIASILGDQDEQPEAGPSLTSKQPAGRTDTTDDIDEYVYSGPVLCVIHNPRARIARSVLAFSTGEVGHYLSEATALLVRLQSTTHVLNLIPDHTYIPPTSSPPVISLRAASLSYEDTENRRHVDVAFDATIWSRILVVDEGGGVWLWWEEKESRNGQPEKVWNLRKVRSAVTQEKHQFFRIAFGTKPGTALVISSREAVLIDIDDPEHPTTTLFTLGGKDRFFTSLEKTALEWNVAHTVACTNREAMWIDPTSASNPVMSWKHDYGANLRDLEVGVVPCMSSKATCNGVPHDTVRHPTITFASVLFGLAAGSSQLPHSLLAGFEKTFTLPAVVAQSGTSREKEERISELKAIWDEEIQRIAKCDGREQNGEGATGTELNLRGAWLEINQPFRLDGDPGWFSPAETERYVRELDAPLEHLMTAADLARDSIYSQPPDIRSHLLAPLPFPAYNVPSTLDALDELDLSKHVVVASTLSEYLPVLENARPPLAPSQQLLQIGSQTVGSKDSRKPPLKAMTIYRRLRESFPDTSNDSLRSTVDAGQLAIDLKLSLTILSSEPLHVPLFSDAETPVQATQEDEEPDELFARAAGQLSLTDKEPSPITFGLLNPRESSSNYDESDDGNRSTVETGVGSEEWDGLRNLTARALLADWKVGENLSEWSWKSWRKGDQEGAADRLSHSHNTQRTPVKTQSSSQSLSQRLIKPLPSPRLAQSQGTFVSQQHQHYSYPSMLGSIQIPTISPAVPHTQPRLKSTMSMPSLQNLPPSLDVSPDKDRRNPPNKGVKVMQRSSPPPMMNYGIGSSQPQSSQPEEPLWAATQVERGPHGGREKKKKAGKKRVGGF